MAREISCDAKACAVKTFALAEEIAFILVVKRVIEIDVGAEMRVTAEYFEFRVVALRISGQRRDKQDCGQQQQLFHGYLLEMSVQHKFS